MNTPPQWPPCAPWPDVSQHIGNTYLQVASMQPIITDLQQQKEAAELKVNGLRASMEALAKDVTFTEDAVEYLSQKRDVLGLEMNNLDTCVSQITEQRISKQKRLAEAREMLSTAQGDVQSLTSKVKSEQARLAQAQGELTAITMTRLQLQTDIASISEEIKTLRNTLEQVRCTKQELADQAAGVSIAMLPGAGKTATVTELLNANPMYGVVLGSRTWRNNNKKGGHYRSRNKQRKDTAAPAVPK
ncbi:hypothetical protein JKP88DRAFT_244851 [Tribonema minus]|uniref:Uncharacterized protein n=1 Tax=Tribonema minus TaxID=303371 RepID=A0A835Z805_9STRA|nr:hypothetical protein JKP88DRAFT_244851 [Tribonema minus]